MKTKEELITEKLLSALDCVAELKSVAHQSADLLNKLPERLVEKANFRRTEWLQFSGCTRDEAEEIQIFLKTHFSMRPNLEPDKVDYRGKIDGLNIVIYAVPYDLAPVFDLAARNNLMLNRVKAPTTTEVIEKLTV
jgi:hypothetical protein